MRNIINVDQVDLFVNKTLRTYGITDKPITRWFNQVFRNWIIREYPEDKLIQLNDYPGDVKPAWYHGPATYHWIPLYSPELSKIRDRCLEYLLNIVGTPVHSDEHRFLKISVEQALAKWNKNKINTTINELKRNISQAEREICSWPDGFYAIEFQRVVSFGKCDILRRALSDETTNMGICVGKFYGSTLEGDKGEIYANGVETGVKRIFSLRDQKGFPHCTMEAVLYTDENYPFWRMGQIQGKQNNPPNEKYLDYIVDILNHIRIPISNVYLLDSRIKYDDATGIPKYVIWQEDEEEHDSEIS
jgi:hypothetical protein